MESHYTVDIHQLMETRTIYTPWWLVLIGRQRTAEFPIDAWGYAICFDGNAILIQDVDPEAEGMQFMTEARAAQMAERMLAYYQSLEVEDALRP